MAGLTYAEILKYEGNWKEDSNQENGNYINTCISCKNLFIGNKYRVVCKNCYKPLIIDAVSSTERESLNTLLRFKTKETIQLAEILEKDRGITITTAHPTFVIDSILGPPKLDNTYWRKGKLRTKKKKKK